MYDTNYFKLEEEIKPNDVNLHSQKISNEKIKFV
jgi:hypothetical protein